MAALVPQSEGKLAAQALEHPFLSLLPKVRDNFRIAVGDQAMTSRFQLCTFLRIAEELSVSDPRATPILVGGGLLSIGQSDNIEPARTENNSGPPEISLFVRPAMD